jgi:hypothetical protein
MTDINRRLMINWMSLEKISNKEMGRSWSLSVEWTIEPMPVVFQTPDEKSFDGIWEDMVGQTVVYEGEEPVVKDGVWEMAQHFYCDPRGTRGFISAHFVEGGTQFSP